MVVYNAMLYVVVFIGIIILILFGYIVFSLFKKEKKVSKEIELIGKKERSQRFFYMILYEAFFLIGVVGAFLGYVKSMWPVLTTGLVLMLLSLPILEFMLKWEPKQKEEVLIAKADQLIEREKNFKKKEGQLSKEVEELYNKALTLESKEKELKQKERNGVLDADVKRVLMITDELLAKLPDTEIDKFVASKDFQTYKKVMERVIK